MPTPYGEYEGPCSGKPDVASLGPFALFGIGWRDRMTLQEAQKRTLEHLEGRLAKLKAGSQQALAAQAEIARLRPLARPQAVVQYVSKGEYRHLSAKQKRNASKPGKSKKEK